ncbi:paREP7 [Pyrobaculum oguniense TE7]|uniref:PaREP7 n=1 Tax=Pyrobaculum oguniense (strain DSM 13380 / JCM 10595 / TE7) TaxID=698757 RepID=H6Q7N7_PYROT|nr:paREP7 [Pyrobaculum oguniense TE7]
MSLSAEEKRRFLKALEEDVEFRYAVAGLLGLGEVLNELRKLREDFNKYVEKSEKRWRQNERRWKENEKRWKEWFDTWKKFLEDYEKRWQENERKWEEAYKRFDNIERRLSNVETTVGAVAESQYSRYVWEDLKEEIKARGEAVVRRVRNAKVDNVDVDLLVETDRRVYVVEVKIRPRVEDVGALLAKAEVVKAALGKEAVPILTGTWIGDDVEKYARGKGVMIYSY